MYFTDPDSGKKKKFKRQFDSFVGNFFFKIMKNLHKWRIFIAQYPLLDPYVKSGSWRRFKYGSTRIRIRNTAHKSQHVGRVKVCYSYIFLVFCRLSVGRETTREDIDRVVAAIKRALQIRQSEVQDY